MRNPDTIARKANGEFDTDANHPEPLGSLTRQPAARNAGTLMTAEPGITEVGPYTVTVGGKYNQNLQGRARATAIAQDLDGARANGAFPSNATFKVTSRSSTMSQTVMVQVRGLSDDQIYEPAGSNLNSDFPDYRDYTDRTRENLTLAWGIANGYNHRVDDQGFTGDVDNRAYWVSVTIEDSAARRRREAEENDRAAERLDSKTGFYPHHKAESIHEASEYLAASKARLMQVPMTGLPETADEAAVTQKLHDHMGRVLALVTVGRVTNVHDMRARALLAEAGAMSWPAAARDQPAAVAEWVERLRRTYVAGPYNA